MIDVEVEDRLHAVSVATPFALRRRQRDFDPANRDVRESRTLSECVSDPVHLEKLHLAGVHDEGLDRKSGARHHDYADPVFPFA